MELTLSQKQTLKAWLTANVPNQSDEEMRDSLNALASPTYYVYRPSVPVSEVMLNGFDWTRVDNLSVGKARIWEWMTTSRQVNGEYVFDPSKANIRAGINAVWVGTQADLNVRATVYLHCYRAASVAEKLLKVAGNGTAADSSGDGPATLGYDQPITTQDVIDSLNS